jgi:hypothetical protein
MDGELTRTVMHLVVSGVQFADVVSDFLAYFVIRDYANDHPETDVYQKASLAFLIVSVITSCIGVALRITPILKFCGVLEDKYPKTEDQDFCLRFWNMTLQDTPQMIIILLFGRVVEANGDLEILSKFEISWIISTVTVYLSCCEMADKLNSEEKEDLNIVQKFLGTLVMGAFVAFITTAPICIVIVFVYNGESSFVPIWLLWIASIVFVILGLMLAALVFSCVCGVADEAKKRIVQMTRMYSD